MADVTISGLNSGTPNKDTAVIPFSDGASTYKTSAAGIVAAAPGCILQVLQAFKSDTFVTQALIANGGEAITGLGVTITPKSSSSKMLISFSVTCAGTCNYTQVYFRLRRGSTEIGNGDPASGRAPVITRGFNGNDNNVCCNVSFDFLDAPATTSATTYQLYVGSEQSPGTIFINRSHNDPASSAGVGCRGSSTLTVQEIAG
jgi:hypothetical protein